MKPQAILLGVVAGAASALLSVAGLVSLATPVPVMIASLGWGTASGFVGTAASGAILAALTGSVSLGVLVMAWTTLPAALIAHVAGLARPRAVDAPGPNAQPTLDWFPVSGILFAIALVAIAECLLVSWLTGFGPDAIGENEVSAVIQTLGVDPALAPQFRTMMIRIFPIVLPGHLVAFYALGLYVSAALVRLSGRLERPRDDIPSGTGLPRVALTIFVAAVLACFAPGALGVVGSVVAGSVGMALTLVGFATVHRVTRGSRSRGLLLFAFYVSIPTLILPFFVATVLGLAETARRPSAAR